MKRRRERRAARTPEEMGCAKASRRVGSLTPEQLERKRQTDRRNDANRDVGKRNAQRRNLAASRRHQPVEGVWVRATRWLELTGEERFIRRGVTDNEGSGCLLWQGHLDRDGYGHINIDGEMIRAHRYAWIMTNGDVPQGLFVCHRCDNPTCVNIEHLFLGTALDNNRDAIAKGRRRKRCKEAA